MKLQIFTGIVAEKNFVVIATSMKDGFRKPITRYEYYVDDVLYGYHQHADGLSVSNILGGIETLIKGFSDLSKKNFGKDEELYLDFVNRKMTMSGIKKSLPDVDAFNLHMEVKKINVWGR